MPETRAAAHENRPLFFQRRFLPMWTGFVLGAFADNTLRQALIIGIGFGAIILPGFENGADAIPIVGAFFAIAMMVFSSISGQVADKYETSLMFRRTKLVEVILMSLAAIGFLIGSGTLLVVVLFGMGAQSAFFSPVRIGAMPKYLKPEELIRGNALCNAGLFVSILLGLLIGGYLVERPDAAYLLSIVLVAASFSGWLAIRAAPVAKADAPDLKLNFNAPILAWRVIKYAMEAPGVARPMLGAAAFFYMSTLVTVMMPIYAQEIWGASGGVANIIMGLFAIGAGVGALSAAALSKKSNGLGFATAGIFAAAVLSLLVSIISLGTPGPTADGHLRIPEEFFVLPWVGVLCFAFTLSSAAMGLYMVPLQAAIQRRAPAERRARIMAAGNILNAVAATAGSLTLLAVTGGLITTIGAFFFVTTLQAGIGLYMAQRWRRLKQTENAQADLHGAQY